MKNLIFLFTSALIGFQFQLGAQSPVLNAANTNPAIGDKYTGIQVFFEDPGNKGEDQTWNFKDTASAPTPPSPGENLNFVDPQESGKASDFQSANIASHSPEVFSYNFYSTGQNELSLYGSYKSNAENLISFTNPKKLLQYPFSIGDSFSDTYEGSFTAKNGIIFRKGTVDVKAEGYGKLILPNATYENVLRVYFLEEYTDSSASNDSVATYRIKTVKWYKPDIHYPVLSLSETFDISGSEPDFVNQSGFSLNEIKTAIENTPSKNKALKVFPNPAKENIFVLSEGKIKNVFCFNSIGEAISIQFENNQIKTENLPQGLYFLQIIEANNQHLRTSFVKE